MISEGRPAPREKQIVIDRFGDMDHREPAPGLAFNPARHKCSTVSTDRDKVAHLQSFQHLLKRRETFPGNVHRVAGCPEYGTARGMDPRDIINTQGTTLFLSPAKRLLTAPDDAMTSLPSLMASIVAALITPFIPRRQVLRPLLLPKLLFSWLFHETIMSPLLLIIPGAPLLQVPERMPPVFSHTGPEGARRP